MCAEQTDKQNEIMQTLAGCWERVLGVELLGPDANFFQLGGTSLAALNVTLEAAKEGIALAPDAMFAYPTIQELAAAIELGLTQRDEPNWLDGRS
jgi:hypothetical protein